MGSYRASRTEEDVKRELSDIMRSLKDPRITGLLSIVKLDLSKDLSSCKVYISSMASRRPGAPSRGSRARPASSSTS